VTIRTAVAAPVTDFMRVLLKWWCGGGLFSQRPLLIRNCVMCTQRRAQEFWMAMAGGVGGWFDILFQIKYLFNLMV